MHVFLSAGEPSGDLHAANLLKHLRARQPGIEGFGFGGPHLQAAGGDVLFPLASHAIMGLSGIVRALPTMFRILDQAAIEVARRRPIAAVLIDYPGFHWHLAKRLKRLGVPTVSFVPPQIWAWASFRYKRMRKCFDRVLCSLPFEEKWFRDRGVHAEYVGHPYFDYLHDHGRPQASRQIQKLVGPPTIAVLPGSRSAELDRNLIGQVKALCRIRDRRPDVRFVFACFKEQHRLRVEAALDRHRLVGQAIVGRMSEALSGADAVIAVSGSVGLELLYHGVPSAIVYRVNPLYRVIAKRVLNVPHISIVNLLAGRELFPEFLTSRDVSVELADRVLHWLEKPDEVTRLRLELAALRERVGQPGACARAAEIVLGFAVNRAAA
jgi:lipid-A-disaccharide synthase